MIPAGVMPVLVKPKRPWDERLVTPGTGSVTRPATFGGLYRAGDRPYNPARLFWHSAENNPRRNIRR